MTGRIRFFVPAARRGILQTESGEELAFSVPEDASDLQGGDIVEFEPARDGRPVACQVMLRHRWSQLLNDQHRPLVNQFHHTVHVQMS